MCVVECRHAGCARKNDSSDCVTKNVMYDFTVRSRIAAHCKVHAVREAMGISKEDATSLWAKIYHSIVKQEKNLVEKEAARVRGPILPAGAVQNGVRANGKKDEAVVAEPTKPLDTGVLAVTTWPDRMDFITVDSLLDPGDHLILGVSSKAADTAMMVAVGKVSCSDQVSLYSTHENGSLLPVRNV